MAPKRRRPFVPRAVVGRTRGLAGLWGVRRSFVYRFERARLAARHGLVRRLLFLLLLAAYPASALCAAGWAASPVWANSPGYILAFVVLWTLPPGVLVGACGAGARAFAGERANATLDALVMTPLDRYELVAARLAARLRPHLALLAAMLGTLAVAGLVTAGAAGASLDAAALFVLLSFLTAFSLLYLSALLLGAALGTYFSLRIESAAGGLLAALATFLAIGVAEWIASFIALFVVSFFAFAFGGAGPFVALPLLLGGMFALCGLNFWIGSGLVSNAARRFDAWGQGRAR